MQILIIIRQLGLAVNESKANQEGWLTIKAPHRNNDSHPSFALNIQHGGWKDNGTGEAGDIYSLVQLLNPGMNFKEAQAFIGGKQSASLTQPKKRIYHTDFEGPFWTPDQLENLKSAQQRLAENPGSSVIAYLKSYDGIRLETLQKFGCGLISWNFGRELMEALLIPYPTGAQIYTRGKQGKHIRMIPGSKPGESFMGAGQLSGKKELLIAKSPREAMLAWQELSSNVDVLGTCSGENDKLHTSQGALLTDKARYWNKVFVCRDRDTIPAEKQAFGFARKVSDAIGTFKRDVRLCNLGKLTCNECKDLTDLYNSDHRDRVTELFGRSYSEYIWNSHTEDYRFWETDDKGRLEINEVKFARVLGKFGFKKSYFGEAEEPTLVRDDQNVLSNISSHQLSDFVLDEIFTKLSKYVDASLVLGKNSSEEKLISNSQLQKVFFKYRDKVLSTQIKAIFRQKPIKILTDHASASFLFYKNGVVKVTKDAIQLKRFDQMDGKIWVSQIMNRTFHDTAPNGKGDLEKFVENISDRDPNKKRSYMSALGYLMHTYKNKAGSPAIILVDEKSSPGIAQGGTGKSLFAQSIKYIRAQRYMAGKNVDPSSRFFFMDAQMGDQSLFFDDVRADFDFEALFNVITDDMQVEAKYKNRFTIPFEISPKIILATNSIVKGFGSSFRRRQFTLPFSDFYLKNPVPQEEFGRKLFDDWDEMEWRRYDDFMIRCLQLYLQKGLVKFPTNYHLIRGLTDATSSDFYDWARAHLELDIEYKGNVLFNGLNRIADSSNPPTEKPVNSSGTSFPSFSEVSGDLMDAEYRKFLEWLRQYATFKGWVYNDRVSMGYKIVHFKKR